MQGFTQSVRVSHHAIFSLGLRLMCTGVVCIVWPLIITTVVHGDISGNEKSFINQRQYLVYYLAYQRAQKLVPCSTSRWRVMLN